MTPRVLILCTGNSARSPMAEGLLRDLAAGGLEVFSAGTHPSVVNPLAIEAMAARGLDISHNRSKHMSEFLSQPFDFVITVCDDVVEACPVFPGRAERIHWSFSDPAVAEGDHETRLQVFRQTRDAIEARLRAWLAEQRSAEQSPTHPMA